MTQPQLEKLHKLLLECLDHGRCASCEKRCRAMLKIVEKGLA